MFIAGVYQSVYLGCSIAESYEGCLSYFFK